MTEPGRGLQAVVKMEKHHSKPPSGKRLKKRGSPQHPNSCNWIPSSLCRQPDFVTAPCGGEDVYVIPQHSFGVAAHDVQITISHEHTEYKWFTYEEAWRLIKYDGSRTALWELDKRLKGKGPRG